jgi:hypothetical protein
MQKRPSWYATSGTYVKGFPAFLEPKVHYRVHKNCHQFLSNTISILSMPSHYIYLRTTLTLSFTVQDGWVSYASDLHSEVHSLNLRWHAEYLDCNSVVFFRTPRQIQKYVMITSSPILSSSPKEIVLSYIWKLNDCCSWYAVVKYSTL